MVFVFVIAELILQLFLVASTWTKVERPKLAEKEPFAACKTGLGQVHTRCKTVSEQDSGRLNFF